MILVYMAGCYISDTRDFASTPKEERRFGFPTYRCHMQDAAVQSGPDVWENKGTILSEHVRNWDFTHTLANPPNVARIHVRLSI